MIVSPYSTPVMEMGWVERVLNETDGVHETAAVGIPPPGGGPDQLIVYAVPDSGSTIDPESIQPLMQDSIKRHLNPLFPW